MAINLNLFIIIDQRIVKCVRSSEAPVVNKASALLKELYRNCRVPHALLAYWDDIGELYADTSKIWPMIRQSIFRKLYKNNHEEINIECSRLHSG